MDADPSAAERNSSPVGLAIGATVAVTAALHVPWALWFAAGGDLAAQDFWSHAVDRFPASAYDVSTYGGMHIATYSLVSPYLLGWFGVRPALVVAAVLAAALTTWLVARLGNIRQAWIPGLVGAVAITGNSVSGRATFAIGLVFALAAVAFGFGWAAPAGRWAAFGRAAAVATCAALATLGSPVAGLFLGILAAAAWLTPERAPGAARATSVVGQVGSLVREPFASRRVLAYCLGAPPVAIVLGTAALFPFEGEQPMRWPSALVPVGVGIAVGALAPRPWRVVRVMAVLYTLAVVGAWLVPSPIGTNVTRLGLLFGAVVLAAAALDREAPGRTGEWLAGAAALGALGWAVAVPITDVVRTTPHPAWERSVDALVAELHRLGADRTRIEVIPTASHLDTSELAPEFVLARGWNRQADLARHPLFYGRASLDAASYRAWLDRWAVGYVVVAPGRIDAHAGGEADLVADGLPYLTEAWSHADGWTIYAVADPAPLASPDADVVVLDAAHVTLSVREPGDVTIRMRHSPWLAVDGDACVTSDADGWTVLRADRPGEYTLSAPYRLDRGTPCPAP